MIDHEFKVTCLMCETRFSFGPHAYGGRHVSAWSAMICNECQTSNWDGIVPGSYQSLENHLAAQGVVVERNANGYILWPV